MFLRKSMTLMFLLLTSNAFAGEWQNRAASYEVPVPIELREYSVFELTDLRTREKDGVRHLKYSLPSLLVGGTQIKISLQGSSTNEVLVGKKGAANCAALAECKVRYQNLSLSEAQLRQFLISNGASSAEIEGRTKVLRHFSGDPAGVIRIRQ